jgi:translation initiation factor 6
MMGIVKNNIIGSEYVGAFARSTEDIVIAGTRLNESGENSIKESLGVEVARVSIDGSDLIGLYAAANSKCILVPEFISRTELERFRKISINVKVLETQLNALGNNILVNDKVAIINPEFSESEEAEIGKALDVETVRMSIGGFRTVGANNIINNKGLVANNMATDGELERLRGIFKYVSQSTANTGSLSIGLCAISNSKGLLVGEKTTGFEIARISEGLDL